MFAALMFASKILMEALPNIHLLGMFTMTLTVVFRARALIPIYLYVFLNGLYAGFDVWWFPYLYIWTILWGLTMLVPKNIPTKVAAVIYPLLCGLHGFAFGALYAPAQSLFFGLDFKQTVAWIIAGIPYERNTAEQYPLPAPLPPHSPITFKRHTSASIIIIQYFII